VEVSLIAVVSVFLNSTNHPTGTAKVGQRVAVIGAGGIGFDVSDFLTHNHSHDAGATHAGQPLPNKVCSPDDVLCFVLLLNHTRTVT